MVCVNRFEEFERSGVSKAFKLLLGGTFVDRRANAVSTKILLTWVEELSVPPSKSVGLPSFFGNVCVFKSMLGTK